MGLQIAAVPLFHIEQVSWQAPDPASFDGLLIGSANAIRCGGTQLASLLDLPVYAVGQSTADVALQAGFTIAKVGSGGLQNLLDDRVLHSLHLLRLSGESRVPLVAGANQKIEEIIVYRSVPKAAPSELTGLLREGAVVALHSANAAQHFCGLIGDFGFERETIRIAALGPRIADAAGTGWADIQTAPEPNDTALLEMIENMCQ